jgi:predicted GNAT superfamily acetyltransferase
MRPAPSARASTLLGSTTVTDPWTLARDTASAAGVTLEPLVTVEDADRINDVIDRTWGGQHLDREVVRALAASGNVSWGAIDGDRLVGFVLGWAGVDDGGLHVHSHMLASVPDSRHRGIGAALKFAQRAQALDQGIDRMRWTFDPLLARNAWLNIGKLGAVIDGFERDFYGSMRDTLNVGERSDRAFIAWDLRREPGPRPTPNAADLVRDAGGEPEAVEGVDGGSVAIAIPREYLEVRATDAARADRWRDAIAGAIEGSLAAGRVGIAFDRERSAYVFAAPGGATP